MSIASAIAILGVGAAAAAIWAAYRLVPPLRLEAEGAEFRSRNQAIDANAKAEHEAALLEAITQAEQERRDEIDALRLIMLQQRVEISKLRRLDRERRLQEGRVRTRAHDLELRQRRASKEARHLSELPVASEADTATPISVGFS